MTLAHNDAEHSPPGILQLELGDDPHKPMAPLDTLDGDLDSRLSSLPSTPSTGSTRSKRASPDGDSISDNERGQEIGADQPRRKRANRRSTSSGRSSVSSSDRLPRHFDAFLDFRTRPDLEFVDKTRCILDLPDRFRYLLLRPPRFGKTTFMSTLAKYYDVGEADQFAEYFGPLEVVSLAPGTIHPHSQHLCLSFTLSDIRVYSDITDVAFQLDSKISYAMGAFLVRYSSQLDLAHPQDFLGDRSGDIIAQVFNRVRAFDYTLFVVVDGYDAPTRSRSLDRCFPAEKTIPDVREIERLLHSCLWAPLLAGSDIIDKLFVTGTVSVSSAGLDALHLSIIPPELHSCCGFTEPQALEYARLILGKTPDAEDLRRSCGTYAFLPQSAGGGTVEPVLHPQRLIHRILQLAHAHPYTKDDSFELLSDIFKLLPEQSDIPGAASKDSLIQLLAAGAVDCEMDSAFGFDTAVLTCKALYYAGALTCDSHGNLRIAGAPVLALIHSCVDINFSDRQELWVVSAAWRNYHLDGDIQPFLDCMSEILFDLTLRSLGKKHEPNLRGVFELVIRNRDMNFDRLADPIVLLPPDVTRVEIPAYDSDQVHVWELKTVTLRGLWHATNLNDDEPTIEALEALHQELIYLDEDELLQRPYRVWSPTLNAMETALVSSFFDPEPEVPQFLAIGGVRILMRQRLEEEEEEEEDEGQEEEDLDSEEGQGREGLQGDGDDIYPDS
ncbi:hypothetical protein C8R47DRAFT_1195973 [Mycena vitilis]|nr:hypothetical protein C8R47DRAFT_1195973 [Mycena vitilis]